VNIDTLSLGVTQQFRVIAKEIVKTRVVGMPVSQEKATCPFSRIASPALRR
jgi:hypothetical protein